MGQGRNIKCKCREWELSWGVGMFYPDIYQETLNDIKNGKYGEEMQKLANETELVTVDASLMVYQCKKCGHIESAPCLDLYKPNNIKSARRTIIENWETSESEKTTVTEGLKDWPYWTFSKHRNKFEGDYAILKKYEHKCPMCKEEMNEVEEEEIEKMRCPKCNEKYKDIACFYWD